MSNSSDAANDAVAIIFLVIGYILYSNPTILKDILVGVTKGEMIIIVITGGAILLWSFLDILALILSMIISIIFWIWSNLGKEKMQINKKKIERIIKKIERIIKIILSESENLP